VEGVVALGYRRTKGYQEGVDVVRVIVKFVKSCLSISVAPESVHEDDITANVNQKT
jgi:hypothetical protein